MEPAAFKEFVQEFTAEWNRVQGEAAADLAGRRTELTRVKAQIERLVDALADGAMPAAAVAPKIKALEGRRLTLEAKLAGATEPAPRLHPNLAEIYRQKVAALVDALARDDGAKGRELVRSLVEAIDLVQVNDVLQVQVHGELATILSLASAGKSAPVGPALAQQIKLVAGASYRRSHYETVDLWP